MKHGNFCHYCNHYIGGHGLWAGGDGGSGTGLYAGGNGPPPRGGSLQSIGKAFKSGNLGKIFSPSANRSTASTLIHQGIPLAGEAAGVALGEPLGPAGYIAGGLAGHQVGDAVASEVSKATGYGVRKPYLGAIPVPTESMDDDVGSGLKPHQPYLTGKGASPWIAHVKAYASEHGIKYGQALKHAKESYHAGKASSSAKGSKKNKSMGAISAFMSGAKSTGNKRSAGAWVAHVKAYASQHGVSYKQALSQAKESYHSGKKDPQSAKERFSSEIMHRMNAVPDEDVDRLKADSLKGDYNAAIKKHSDEMLYQAGNAKKRLQDKLAAKAAQKAAMASASALPTGMGLRVGTVAHVHFHRRKLKALKGELNSMESLGMAGTPSHKKILRDISKREAMVANAYHANRTPERMFQYKSYTPVAEDGRKKSKWIHHVKGFANYHGISYKAALSHPDSKSAYQSGDYYTMDRPREKKTRVKREKPVVQSDYELRPRKGRGLKAFVASLPFV